MLVARVAEQLDARDRARRPSPARCRSRAPRRPASCLGRLPEIEHHRQRGVGGRRIRASRGRSPTAAPARWPAHGPSSDSSPQMRPVAADDERPALLVLASCRPAGRRSGCGRDGPARAAGRRTGGWRAVELIAAQTGSVARIAHEREAGRAREHVIRFGAVGGRVAPGSATCGERAEAARRSPSTAANRVSPSGIRSRRRRRRDRRPPRRGRAARPAPGRGTPATARR